jgi:dolichol-phosphate mannosyltransferase
MDKLYIVIPAYNEEETISTVIKEWYTIIDKIGNESKLVIIDDGSKDSTYSIMQREAKERQGFIPLTKPNAGHGATILYGYQYALDQGADYVFQTDSDGQTLPEEFWKFWELRKNYAMLIGNRKSRKDGISRILVTKTLKFVLGLCFHTLIPDANTPFRLMEGRILKENIKIIPVDYNLSNVLIAVIYAKKKLTVKYLPITFRQRQGGVNSINMKRIVKIGRQAVKDFMIINKSILTAKKEDFGR